MFKNDYLCSDDFDLLIQGGDFVQGMANNNHTNIILKSAKGEMRQFPLLGAAINSYIGSSSDIDIIENAIKNELIKDSFTVVEIDVNKTGSSITVDIQVQ